MNTQNLSQIKTSSKASARLIGALTLAATLLGASTASAEMNNDAFHDRFISNVSTNMQSVDCSDKQFRLSGDDLNKAGDCFMLKTKDRTSEVGSVSYTLRAYSVGDGTGNRYAIFTLKLNTSARTGFSEMAPIEMMEYLAAQEKNAWDSWTDVSKLKLSFLKRAQQQFASYGNGAPCTAVSGRRSPSVLYLATTCGETAVTEDAMKRVVSATL